MDKVRQRKETGKLYLDFFYKGLRLITPRILQETCFVAGLLHDISKTFTYDSKGKPNAVWKLCHRDDLTLGACAEGFAYLDKQARELSLTLRHMLTAASPGARYGKPAAMALACSLRDADGQSAMADNE